MAKKVVEKHVTITEETHNKLQALAKKQMRSMRTVVTKLINDEIVKDKQ